MYECVRACMCVEWSAWNLYDFCVYVCVCVFVCMCVEVCVYECVCMCVHVYVFQMERMDSI